MTVIVTTDRRASKLQTSSFLQEMSFCSLKNEKKAKFSYLYQLRFFWIHGHRYINYQSCLIPFSQRFIYGPFRLLTCHSLASSRSSFFNSQGRKKLSFWICGINRKFTTELVAEDRATDYSVLHRSPR